MSSIINMMIVNEQSFINHTNCHCRFILPLLFSFVSSVFTMVFTLAFFFSARTMSSHHHYYHMGYANTACICVWSSEKKRRRRRQTLKTGVVINAVQNMRRNGNECDKKTTFLLSSPSSKNKNRSKGLSSVPTEAFVRS
jgi:hypothetical protein